ncbi:DUF2267 domain-containing protein [Streptomyces sp. NPDC048272]|uniref:DUF2267 domain-containing protein n=1 Tax=Streptomyces sp. NPDC048272 TaxID=3154616 RepID=UPI00343F20D3
MYDQPRPNRPAPAMTFDQMLERVRYEGAYPTRERAEEAVRTVLAALGRQIAGDERVDLAQCLPVEAALALTCSAPDAEQLTGWGFVKGLAAQTGVSPAVARWDTGAVLAAVTRLAGPDLIARVLQRLPDDYALLFGQALLRRPQPTAA